MVETIVGSGLIPSPPAVVSIPITSTVYAMGQPPRKDTLKLELSPMSDNSVNAVFNAFVEAQKAMQRLPEAEAELARKQGELSVTYERLGNANDYIQSLQDRLVEMEAKLAAKEAELAQATFRETEAKSKLDTVVSVLKGTVDEATAVMDLVNPPPPPPPPVVEPEPDPTTPPTAPVDTAGSSSNASSANADGVTDYNSGFDPGGPNHRIENLPGVYQQGFGLVNTDVEATRSSEDPFANSQDTAGSTPPNAPSQDAAPSNAASTPFAGRAYWEKPDNMTWDAWRAGGGDIPYWVAR